MKNLFMLIILATSVSFFSYSNEEELLFDTPLKLEMEKNNIQIRRDFECNKFVKLLQKELLPRAYGSFFSNGAQLVEIGGTVQLNDVSFTTEKTVELECGQVTIRAPGEYFVSFGAACTPAELTSPQITLFVNGAPVIGTSLNLTDGSQLNSMSTIIRVETRPAILSIVNTSGVEILIQPAFTNDISVFLSLEKLHNLKDICKEFKNNNM